MERAIAFTEGHQMFRETFAKFLHKEIGDQYPLWEDEGIVPRELWKKFGDNGFLIPWLPKEYGGAGADWLYSVIITEELARYGASGVFVPLHNDIVAPYLYSYGTEEQKKTWLPRCASGEVILAVAMTEPDAGSDLASMRTTAKRDGDTWVLNGQKTFISNGHLADLVVVAAKTGGPDVPPHHAVSLFLVERGAPGFTRGPLIKKIGLKAQDTAELFFDDCRISSENLLGEEGKGFIYLMQKLQQERLVCAIGSMAAAERAIEVTIDYVKERRVFGKPLSKFQHTQFLLAELASEVTAGRCFVDQLINNHIAGKDVTKETCMAKYWVCEMAMRVADRCLQLFGGYGYCTEYPISRFFVDGRIQSIYAGTSEIMKLIVSRLMGL